MGNGKTKSVTNRGDGRETSRERREKNVEK